MFVSIKGSAYARFRRALETDSASLATAAAYELPQLNLAEALRLCLLYAPADRSRFDRAIVAGTPGSVSRRKVWTSRLPRSPWPRRPGSQARTGPAASPSKEVRYGHS